MLPAIILLLVEDDPTIRGLLHETLQEGGFELVLAESGTEAMAIMDARIEVLRGLITDVDLGSGPDGWQLARHARVLKPDLPVVYMSGASSHDWASCGVPKSTMVAKPFAPAQILTAIAALLNATDAHH